MRSSVAKLLLLSAFVVLSGCSDDGDPVSPGGGEEPVSFAADIQPLFDAACIGCHGQNGQAGLDLRSGSSRGNLVGVVSTSYGAPLVAAGDPAGSVLYDKLTGAGTYGQPMPPNGAGFNADELELVRSWIADGAPDN